MSDVGKRCVKCGALFGASMVDRQDGPDNTRHYFRDICIRNLRAENERLRSELNEFYSAWGSPLREKREGER